MKITMFLFLFLAVLNSFAQKVFQLKDLFTENKIVWFGIDYSRAEFVGTFTNKDLHEYFHGWNKLFVEEPFKYDVRRFLQKKSVVNEISYVEKINEESTPNIRNIESGTALLKKSDLADMVSAYQSNQTEGLGFVMIAETYNRTKDFATHYAVIFDIASKKILISQKFTAVPDGIGLRNYWAPTILDSLRQLAKNYKRWKEKYGKISHHFHSSIFELSFYNIR